MLLQSHQGFAQMLPALPSVWSEGSVRGLHARGNFICSMQWAGGRLTAGTVESVIGRTLYKASFETEAGKTYKLVI